MENLTQRWTQSERPNLSLPSYLPENTQSKFIGWIVFSIDYLSSLRPTSIHGKEDSLSKPIFNIYKNGKSPGVS